jgi:hypothetical protein
MRWQGKDNERRWRTRRTYLISRQACKLVEKGWQRAFEDPISLLDGPMLFTLHDAATYTTKLPKKESDLPVWQTAIGALMPVVNLGGPTMFARIGFMRALNRGFDAGSIRSAKSITGESES